MDKQERAFLRQLTHESFGWFVRIFGGYNQQGGDTAGPIYDEVFKFVGDERIKRKGLAMPRTTRKTTICDRWKPIWLYLRDPEERIMIGAEIKDIASESVKWIKNTLINHQFLRYIHPQLQAIDARYINKHTFSDTELLLPRKGGWAEPTVACIGVGGSGQGKHYTRLFLTDLIGDKAMTSQTIMLDTILWCDNLDELVVEPHVDNPNASEIQIDFTHWAVGDCYEYLQDKYPAYQWLIVPAIKCGDDMIEAAQRGHKNIVYIQHPAQEIGETNFVDVVDENTGLQRFPTKFYEDMRTSPEKERIFHTQHQNMPHNAESGTNPIKIENITNRFYRIEDRAELGEWFITPDDKAEIPIEEITFYGIIDPGGFSLDIKHSSRWASLIAGRHLKSKKKFVRWTWAGRPRSTGDALNPIFAAHKKYRPRLWKCEVLAQQRYIFNHIREQAAEKGVQIIVSEITGDAASVGKDAKVKRIDGLVDPIAGGEYYFLPDQKALIAELTSHPFGITNDLADAMAWFEKHWGGGRAKSNILELNKRKIQEYMQRHGVFGGGR